MLVVESVGMGWDLSHA